MSARFVVAGLLSLGVLLTRARAEACTADSECAMTEWCDGSVCAAKKPNGEAASDARACTSGILADAVCCNAACTGICESCDATGSKGTCVPVLGPPRHGACPFAVDACSQTSCDGVVRAECKRLPGTETTCRPTSCAAGVETSAALCDGSGTCPAATTKSCGEYVCDGNKCRTTCRSNPDCAPGFTCDEVETKKCLPAATCDGDHTIKSRNGADKDCSPYKCEKTFCLEACVSTSQCTEGFACNGKECVRTALEPTNDDGGGCAFGASPRGSFLALAAVALLLRQRHKPTCGSRRSP